MKPLALALAAASSLAMVAAAPAEAGHGYSQQEMVSKFMRIFDRLDRNHNGRISRDTVRRMEDRGYYDDGPRVAVVFGDENFRIAFGTGGDRYRSNRRDYIGPINSRTFYMYDLNRDGYIYRQELRRAVIREFHHADRNGDGYLSDRELERSGWFQSSSYHRSGYYPDRRRYDTRTRIVVHADNHNDRNRHNNRNDRNHNDRDRYDRDHRGDRHDNHADRNRRDNHHDGDRNRDRDRRDADRGRDGRRDGDRQRDGSRQRDRDGDKDRNRDRDGKRERNDGDRKRHQD